MHIIEAYNRSINAFDRNGTFHTHSIDFVKCLLVTVFEFFLAVFFKKTKMNSKFSVLIETSKVKNNIFMLPVIIFTAISITCIGNASKIN